MTAFCGDLGVGWRRIVVVEQDAVAGAVEIVELAGLQRPQEGGQAEQAQHQGQRDQPDAGRPSARAARFRRSALTMTRSDEVDMAIAATSGVTRPATASGTVSRL